METAEGGGNSSRQSRMRGGEAPNVRNREKLRHHPERNLVPRVRNAKQIKRSHSGFCRTAYAILCKLAYRHPRDAEAGILVNVKEMASTVWEMSFRRHIGLRGENGQK